jgi:hypothetical protein
MLTWTLKCFVAIACTPLAMTISLAQSGDDWHRVVTGPGFNIDVSIGSLKLDANRVFSARFKTTLSKSESVGGQSSEKYKTRLETIEFSPNDRQYRLRETTLLDSSGKKVLSSSSEQWKPIKGTASELYYRAMTLPPFGSWKVITYRYADGKPAGVDDPADLRNLIGSSLWLRFDGVQLGGKTCSAPSFQLKTFDNDEFVKRTGNPLKFIEIVTDKIDAVLMKCDPDRSSISQTFFLQLPNGKLMLLWEGVFVELESPKGGWGTSLLRLITN